MSTQTFDPVALEILWARLRSTATVADGALAAVDSVLLRTPASP